MDRISNNESLVTIATLQILTLFDNIDIAKLDILLVFCIDRAIRKRLLGYKDYMNFVAGENRFEMALNRKFNEFQPIILNTFVMMKICGLIDAGSNQVVSLSKHGLMLANKSIDFDNDITDEIFTAINNAKILFDTINTKQLYIDLKIVL